MDEIFNYLDKHLIDMETNNDNSLVSQIFRSKHINSVKLLLNLNEDFSIKECTEEDVDRLTKRKSRFELIILSLVVCGIEFCYAAETGMKIFN